MGAAWTHNSSEPLDSRSLSASSLSADVEGLFTSLDVEGSHVFAASKNVPYIIPLKNLIFEKKSNFLKFLYLGTLTHTEAI